MADDNARSYSDRQHEFVSNLTGTSKEEISLVLFIFPIISMLYNLKIVNLMIKYGRLRWIMEFLAFVFVPLLVVTALSKLLFFIVIIMLLLAMVAAYQKWSEPDRVVIDLADISKKDLSWLQGHLEQRRLPCIAYYRVAMMICTVICILAVDFLIFPRRFAKTEQFGTGLMDIGVGSFVFSNAVTSSVARRGHSRTAGHVQRSVGNALPIIVLGMIRLASVKLAGYNEHASEYGIHWNFFFTLAFTKMFSSFLLGVCSKLLLRHVWILALAVMSFYQLSLSMGLSVVVQTVSFVGEGSGLKHLIIVNSPGLASLCGFVSLYLFGVYCGQQLHLRKYSEHGRLTFLAIQAVIFGVLTTLNGIFVQEVSRQLANASYVLWQVSLNSQILCAFELMHAATCWLNQVTITSASRETPSTDAQALLHLINERRNTVQANKPRMNVHMRELLAKALGLNYPQIIAAVDRNQLFCFLLANLLTGFVNVTVHTLDVGNLHALFILTVYLFAVSAAVLVLDIRGINTKLW